MKIGVSIANDSRESIRANRIAVARATETQQESTLKKHMIK